MSATTGARLRPISSTTAPATTGGNARLTRPGPMRWTSRPTTARTRPATTIAPVTSAVLPPAARIAATPPTNDALVPR
ncbi:hypothetical protein HDC93_004753 [Streptomyces sp. AK010]|nr:hypothetical protein [Streptomyces sp. AK010]